MREHQKIDLFNLTSYMECAAICMHECLEGEKGALVPAFDDIITRCPKFKGNMCGYGIKLPY